MEQYAERSANAAEDLQNRVGDGVVRGGHIGLGGDRGDSRHQILLVIGGTESTLRRISVDANARGNRASVIEMQGAAIDCFRSSNPLGTQAINPLFDVIFQIYKYLSL